MKQLFIVLSIFLLSTIIASTSYSVPVSGYNSYINSLPGGKDRQAENFNIIDMAQEEVTTLENKRRLREIKFTRPVNVEELTPKYLMIAFEVAFKPAENSRFSPNPAIYGLLFEQDASYGIKKFTSFFIKWLDKNDIDEYNAATKNDFCSYFMHIGVEDCTIDSKKTEIRKTTVAEKKTPLEINGNQIVSGIVKEKYIDPQIVRKKDLEDVIQKLSPQDLQKTVSLLREENTNLKSNTITSLEKKLTEEKRMREQLEKRISILERLLKNVSLKNNELIFEGINVRIVNGTNSVQGDGKGNLIMGYIENSADKEKIANIIGNFSHKVITVEDKVEENKEGDATLLPDYGTKDKAEDMSLIRFLLK
ncbi:MAG: hypothetical protein KJ737_20855 [Proteobacteria bacterium]|nr:hypothetical protein [Pseudomonadota bacterium]